ncbi:ABC transporter C family member 14-like [Prunus yedoensis var. nudiflora]|uniref:ABC transporter C family member 14-like n=1 Tax=Prunus yedoensis var. nudiflora TaxID=2094558 RepID=A0A314Z790_PRUYE|nr:ABC transporter C family member 14-like [Prunus yedoensis var. nudiflora]
MRDGMIVQAGKYNDLLNSGLDFKELVAAHETSIELVEMSTTIPSKSSPSPPISPQLSSNHREANGGNNSLDQPKSDNRTSKLIKEEEKETGKVSLHVYKAPTDQTNINQFLPFILGMTIAMYITVLAIFIVVCQNSWPTVFLLIPLIWLISGAGTVMQVQVKPPSDLWQEVANLLLLPPTFLHSV